VIAIHDVTPLLATLAGKSRGRLPCMKKKADVVRAAKKAKRRMERLTRRKNRKA
jgi:hypothetical protein